MMDDLRRGIWSELRKGQSIDVYRRALQRSYIELLGSFMIDKPSTSQRNSRSGTRTDLSQSDIRPLVRAQLKSLRLEIVTGNRRIGDRMSTYHLNDAIVRIDQILDPK